MKHRLTTLIAEIHTHLLELSQFPGWDFIRPLPHPPASPEQIAGEIGRLLRDAEYNTAFRERLTHVRERLGGGGADRRMAGLVLSMVEQS